MIANLGQQLKLKIKEQEDKMHEYEIFYQKKKDKGDMLGDLATVENNMSKVSESYRTNLREITDQYSKSILVIKSEIQELKFASNRIIKAPDLAKNTVSLILESVGKLEPLIPHFEKFIKKVDKGEVIRDMVRGYFERKDVLIKEINKRIFLMEFKKYRPNVKQTTTIGILF